MMTPDLGTENRQDPAAAGLAATQERSVLLALRQRGERYRFLDRGYRYLSVVDMDPPVTLEVLKALVEIGLGQPARELLDHRRDLATAGLDLAGLRKAVALIPTGLVDWRDLAGTFKNNLAALLEAKPVLAPYEQELRTAPRKTQLFRDRYGRLHLSQRPAGGHRQWIPAITDHAELGQLEFRRADLAHAVAILGFPTSDLIEQISIATAEGKQAGTAPMYLLDPSSARFSTWLHTNDRRSILRDERVYVFVGHNALKKFEQFLDTNDDLDCPRLQFTCHVTAAFKREFEEATVRVTHKRSEAYQRAVARLQQRASARSSSDWADLLRPGAKVLGITSRHTTMLQYSMRDIGDALSEAGFDFHRLIEAADHRQLSGMLLAKTIERIDPALVVLINHLRQEQLGPLHATPILTWVQDPIETILSAEAGASIRAHDFLCGYYRDRCLSEFGYPAEQFLQTLFFPVSKHLFHDGPVPEPNRTELACDLMYAGHFTGTTSSLLEEYKSKNPPHTHSLLDGVYEQMMDIHRSGRHPEFDEPEEIVGRHAQELGVDLADVQKRSLAHFFAFRLFDIAFRHETLEWVGRWADRRGKRFRLYGKGWDADPTLSRWAVGPVEHGEPLRRAYRSATFSLQCNPHGFPHQRSFEALMSGSLVLSRFSPRDYFGLSIAEFERRRAAGEELGGVSLLFPDLKRIVFHDAEELDARAEQYLSDAQARHEVQQEMARIVRRSHTYSAIVPGLVEQIRQRLGSGVDSGRPRPAALPDA